MNLSALCWQALVRINANIERRYVEQVTQHHKDCEFRNRSSGQKWRWATYRRTHATR